MKSRLTALALVLALLSAFVALPVTARAATPAPSTPSTSSVTVPINQTGLTGTLGGVPVVGNLTGNLVITGFQVVNGTLSALGSFTGSFQPTVNGANSGPAIPINLQNLTLPVTGATGSCQILDLTVGAIHLDLLGLVVDTNSIHLNITAQSGPGNLLGNLLCTIAHLLDNSNQNPVANLLNQILGLLNGLTL